MRQYTAIKQILSIAIVCLLVGSMSAALPSTMGLISAPSLSSPSNGATGVSTKPSFSWSSVSGATHYWLMVSTSKSYLPTDPSASSCPNCVISEESLTSTSYTSSSSLNEGTTYYWQVQAYEWGGSSVTEQGEYSNQWSFTTKTISEKPGAFTLSGEALLDGSNPYNHLSWTASSEATSYDVYRDGSHYYDLATLGTTFDNIEVTEGITYTYFIRATNAQGSTDSNTVTVTTKIPKFSTTAPPPSHQSPSNGATVSTTPTIRWSSVPDADAYGLYISEPPYGSSNLVVDTTVYGTSYTVSSGVLDPRVLYYWNMNSYNDAGWGDCSSSWSFTTETPISIPDPPTPQSPGSSYEPGPTISTLTPLFWWTDVDDADEYAFSVSKYPYGSSNVIYNKQGLTRTSWTIPPGYLEEGEKYRWNMQAHNSAGWSEVSSTLHFQTSGVTDAEIVSYSPSSLTEVEVGKSISLSVTIKNTGNTAWQFIAGASVWNHATGSLVADYEKTLTTLQPGQQTTASWSHPVQAEGDYRVQFGAWKQKPYTSSNLLDKKPDPSQVLIRGIVVQDKSVTLTLYVREGSASGPVIAEARVTGQDGAGKSFDKTTSTSGYVIITGAPGTWSFTASKSGYLPEGWEQDITSTCTKHAYLQQVVSDTAERSSIEINIEPFGAKVYLDGNYLGESSSSMFIIEDVQAGEHSLRIAKTGFIDWKFTVLLAAGERKTLRVTLEEYILETGGLRVRVRDENGDPVAEAEVVSIDEPEDQSTLRDVTDSTGKCVWEDILTGPYSIRVSKDGYIDQVVSVKVKPTSTKTVEVTLVSLTTIDDEPMLVSLCLHVVSSTGEPLSGVIVTGEYRAGEAFEENTDSNGYVTLTGAPGEWTLSASKIGYNSKTWHTIVTSSTTENLILQPEPEEVTFTLYVHEGSSSGLILSGVRVTGRDGDDDLFDVTTNSQGYVTIAGAPGSWSFSASKSGYDANTWSQSIISTCTKNAYLQQVEPPILTVVPSGFLTLPFTDPGITIQQGWRYTAPIGPNPDDPYAHNGIDYIKGVVNQPSTWQPFNVVAAADGVAMCSSGGGYSDFVLIRHTETDDEGRNYFTLYGHLGSIEDHITYRADRFATDYKNWTPVSRGEKIGVAGSTGISDPSWVHLHFEVMRGGYAQNKVDSYDIYHTRDYYPGEDRYVSYGPNCLWLADFISLPLNEAGRVILIEPLQIAPSGPYFVRDTLTAIFTVKNIGDASITLDKLLFGGRFNGDELPGGVYPDFTRESVTLRLGEKYRYEGTLALPEPGEYEFFIAYYIGNPTEAERAFLDENNWNTAIELGEGLSDADRTRSLIVYPVEADEIEGSGEVTVKPLFEITDYSVSPSEVRIGEKVSASVTIKNNDDAERMFYVSFAVKDLSSNWEIVPYETITLEPKTIETIILYWIVDSPRLCGYYDIKITVWTYEPHKVETIEIPNTFKVVVESPHPYQYNIDETWIIRKQGSEQIRIHFQRLEVSEGDKITLYNGGGDEIYPLFHSGTSITDYWTQWVYGDTIKIRLKSDKAASGFGFLIDKIEERELPTYYNEHSRQHSERLSYGISTQLVSLSKEELTENSKDIADKLTEPIKFELKVSYLDLLEKDPSLPPAIKPIIKKANDLIKIIGYTKYIIEYAYGDKPTRFRWIMVGGKFIYDTQLAFNYVNFIIVKIAQNEYDVYVISNEQLLNIDNKIQRIPGRALPHYIGTYEQLPQIFIKKMG